MTPSQKQLALRACEAWREMTDGQGLLLRDCESPDYAVVCAFGGFPSGVEWRCQRAYQWTTLRESTKAVLHDVLRLANQAAMSAACSTDFKQSRKKK